MKIFFEGRKVAVLLYDFGGFCFGYWYTVRVDKTFFEVDVVVTCRSRVQLVGSQRLDGNEGVPQ